jgi:chromosome segregation protein
MRDLMRAVYVADYRSTTGALSDLATNWEAVSARESSSQARINELEGEQSDAVLAARNAESALNETRDVSAQINLEAERARQQLSHLGEQLRAAQNRAQQFARDREAIVQRSALVSQEESRLREDLSSLEEAMREAHRSLADDEEAHRISQISDAEAEARLDAARTHLYETTTHLERWRQLHRQFGEAVDRADQRMQGLGLEQERASSQATANESERGNLSALLSDGEHRQTETSSLLSATVSGLAAAREARTGQSQAHVILQRDLTATEHRLKSLVELDQRHAYFSGAVQMLLEPDAGTSERSFTTLGTLADHVNVAPGDESMIEAVLRNELEYVLVPTFDDAFAAIDFLKMQGGGRATFVVTGLHGSEHPTPIINSDFPDADHPRRDDPSYHREDPMQMAASSGEEQSDPPSGEPPAPQPTASTLLPLLGLEPELAATFSRAFPRLAAAPIFENSDGAMEELLAANGSAAASLFLTRTGERIVGGRIVSGGSATEKGTGVLALRREINELRERLERQTTSARESQQNLESLDEQIARLDAERNGLDTALRGIEKEIAVLREQSQQVERESQRIQTHLRVIAQDTGQVERELAEYRSKFDHAATETDRAAQSHSTVEVEVSSTQDEVAALRARSEGRSQEIARQRAEYAAASERRRGLQNDINRLDNESRELESRLQRSQLESVEADGSIKSLDESIATTKTAVDELAGRLEEVSAQLSDRTLKLNEVRETLESLEQGVRNARQMSTQAREERAQLELDRVRLTSALEHISESCQHELNEKIIDIIERLDQVQVTEGPDGDQTAEMEASPVEAPREDGDESEAGELAEGDVDISFWRVPENFDLGEAKARLEELRAKIDALGPINMMALEELNEVEERYIFLSQQKADIEKAVSDTQAAIAEIRRRSRERFVEAFAAINANFSVMFQELFGGGRGEMRLIDESDILESGIEIIAQPPGKRLQNVLLLSGGEKAMAAIALVLAIFKYRPSPFCILDEVDAPLDEVNIGRFADKVTELSTNTQFVIITHSKRTMEAAKALYGVTMEDPGVSKLISVRLT